MTVTIGVVTVAAVGTVGVVTATVVTGVLTVTAAGDAGIGSAGRETIGIRTVTRALDEPAEAGAVTPAKCRVDGGTAFTFAAPGALR